MQEGEKDEDEDDERKPQKDERRMKAAAPVAFRLFFGREFCVEAVDGARNMLIDGQRDERRHKAAQDVEGQHRRPEIERIKVLLRAGGKERRHHAEDGLPAPAEHQNNVGGHEGEAVEQHRERRGKHRARRKRQKRPAEGAVTAVDEPRGNDEGEPDEDVRRIPHEHGGGGNAHELYEHHHDDDDAPGERPQRERADEDGDVRKAEFQKGGKGEREREVEDVEERRERREERDHCDARGGEVRFCSHKNTSKKFFGYSLPEQTKPRPKKGRGKAALFLFSSGL